MCVCASYERKINIDIDRYFLNFRLTDQDFNR